MGVCLAVWLSSLRKQPLRMYLRVPMVCRKNLRTTYLPSAGMFNTGSQVAVERNTASAVAAKSAIQYVPGTIILITP